MVEILVKIGTLLFGDYEKSGKRLMFMVLIGVVVMLFSIPQCMEKTTNNNASPQKTKSTVSTSLVNVLPIKNMKAEKKVTELKREDKTEVINKAIKKLNEVNKSGITFAGQEEFTALLDRHMSGEKGLTNEIFAKAKVVLADEHGKEPLIKKDHVVPVKTESGYGWIYLGVLVAVIIVIIVLVERYRRRVDFVIEKSDDSLLDVAVDPDNLEKLNIRSAAEVLAEEYPKMVERERAEKEKRIAAEKAKLEQEKIALEKALWNKSEVGQIVSPKNETAFGNVLADLGVKKIQDKS